MHLPPRSAAGPPHRGYGRVATLEELVEVVPIRQCRRR